MPNLPKIEPLLAPHINCPARYCSASVEVIQGRVAAHDVVRPYNYDPDYMPTGKCSMGGWEVPSEQLTELFKEWLRDRLESEDPSRALAWVRLRVQKLEEQLREATAQLAQLEAEYEPAKTRRELLTRTLRGLEACPCPAPVARS